MKILTPKDLKHSASSPDHSVWIVEKLLRTNRQRISLLCGSPHAGKSTVARQLAIAVAQGQSFLGRETLKSKVAYWQSEETVEDAVEDFTKSGMTQDDPIVVLHPSPADNHLTELDKVLTEDKDIRLVIIETLDDFLQMDDLSDNPSARRAFERFDREVVSNHKERVCFIAIHHFKKSDEQRGTSLNRILGATVIAGKTDCKIYLRQNGEADSRRVISAQTRKGVPIEPTYLAFDEETQSSMLGHTLTDERADSKKFALSMSQADFRQRCIDTVGQNAGLSVNQIYDKIGGKKKTVTDTLKSLIDAGVVVSQIGGATKTAHLLYLKGATLVEPVIETPVETPVFILCADDDCTTQVSASGEFCHRHKWVEANRTEEQLCAN